MKGLVAANPAVRFLLELAALAAVAYSGARAGDGAVGWILAVAASLAVVAVRGAVVAPKAAGRASRSPSPPSRSRAGR